MNTGEQQRELETLRHRIAELEQQNAQHIHTETELREELRRFTDLLDFSTDWIWEVDVNANFRYVSPKCHELLGYEPEELVGMLASEILFPDERQKVAETIGPMFMAHQPYRGVETAYKHKDGHAVWTEISAVPLFDQHGEWCGYRGISIDIAERQQMEAALRQREASLNEAQRLAHLGDWEWNIATGFLTWSDEVYRIFGYQPQSLAPTFDAFAQAIHPDDRIAVQAAIQQAMSNDTSYAIQYRVVHPDGEHRTVFAEGEQTRAADGTPVRMFGIVQDITERVRAEEAIRQLNVELEERVETRTRELRQNQQLLQTVMDALPIAIFWKDDDLVFRGCNQAFASVTGFSSPADFIGKTDYDMSWKPEEADFFRMVDRRVMETGVPELNIEETVKTAQGEQRWLLTSKLPLRDPDGAVVGIIGAFEDITERKKTEENLRMFMAMAESSSNGIGIASPEGIITYANPAFRNLFGYGDETIGKVNVTLFTEEDQQKSIPSLLETVFSRGSSSGLLTGQRKDGSTFPAQVSPSVIRDSAGNLLAIPAIVRDISDQHRQEAERAMLQQQVIEAQRVALRELSSPLIPIADRVVIMPLIGTIDTERAQQIMETLLEGVAQHQADIAIVDITGVQTVDTQVANALIQAAQSVRLLGANVVLTGIGPAMAQTLIHLGVDLSSIVTRGTLQSGIAYAMRGQL